MTRPLHFNFIMRAQDRESWVAANEQTVLALNTFQAGGFMHQVTRGVYTWGGQYAIFTLDIERPLLGADLRYPKHFAHAIWRVDDASRPDAIANFITAVVEPWRLFAMEHITLEEGKTNPFFVYVGLDLLPKQLSFVFADAPLRRFELLAAAQHVDENPDSHASVTITRAIADELEQFYKKNAGVAKQLGTFLGES